MKISEQIASLVPYKPGKPIAEVQRELGLSKVYKLASNENPLGLSPLVKTAIVEALEKLSLYPDASCFELNHAVAKYYGVHSEQLAFGNGSEDSLSGRDSKSKINSVSLYLGASSRLPKRKFAGVD